VDSAEKARNNYRFHHRLVKLTDLPGIYVRAVDYEITDRGDDDEIITLVTNITDQEEIPAVELAAAYHERWVRHEVAWSEWNSQKEDRPLDGEARRAVGGDRRRARTCRGPETGHAAGVDQDAVAAGDQQRQERAGAEVHALPVDGEGSLPLLAGVLNEAGAAEDARVAEDQVDVIGGMLPEQLSAEPQDLRLIGDVANMASDPDAGRSGRRQITWLSLTPGKISEPSCAKTSSSTAFARRSADVSSGLPPVSAVRRKIGHGHALRLRSSRSGVAHADGQSGRCDDQPGRPAGKPPAPPSHTCPTTPVPPT
jgi:hypothetical protein